ncbi:MAG: esterase [Gammaproteobacteria bacterium]
MIKPNSRVLWLPLVFTLLSGCAADTLYRHDFHPCVADARQRCDANSLQLYHPGTASEFMLGFVEIDDQGQLRDRSQLQALLDALYSTADESSLLIHVFVHGWHHSAEPGDANIESFKNSLASLSAKETKLSQRSNRPARTVAGVYIGWRGDSISLPVLNSITFWDRKNTAQEVGYLGVAEILLKLEEIVNVRNAIAPLNSRLVVLGHSFGGAVVYSALGQILADRFVDSQSGKSRTDTAKGFGDLVVLLNPAFEALRYASFFDQAQARCSYFKEQKPKLVILTSEADYATRLAFPAGRSLSTIFETHDTIERNDCKRPVAVDEGAADRQAVGHFEPLLSHTLKALTRRQHLRTARSGNMETIWSSQEQGGSTRFGSTVLRHLGKTDPLNPYLNIRVDDELIPDHNDVFGNRVMEFIGLLIELSTPE